ncbi:MAG TPA: DUF951 domain-containing protein [Clostridiaceae bacterium]|jgi:hypothetical protein|nr:DUF951 domain-containing protein [Clostridiaceae bacterium]
MINRVFKVNDIVELKKQHPCGSRLWKILRTGADFRIECLGCKHSLMIPRPKFEKSVKKIVDDTAK